MDLIFPRECLNHLTGRHPECPERLFAFRELGVPDLPEGETFLSLVHTTGHIERVRSYAQKSLPLDPDTYTSTDSFEAACAAVAAGITAAETGGFALARPPGHHAYQDKATGFCLFNSIAIAARYLCNQGKKVLILDIDGHLGDGTSAIYYGESQVLFCSLHQYPAFPGTGWVNEIGTGAGKGFTINIPMPPGSADDIFWSGMEFLLPIIRDFNPDVAAVSAGFDAHSEDPLLQLDLSLSCYHKCGSWLNRNFNNVFAILEGGYNLSVLPKAIKEFHRGCEGRPPSQSEPETKSDAGTRSVFDSSLDQLHQEVKIIWNL